MCALSAIVLTGLLICAASEAGAWATITVNSLADPGAPHICALRDAITAANSMTQTNGCTAGKGHDTIQFSVTGTIKLADTLPEITDAELTINGPASPGITIDGGGAVQVMDVGPGATVHINNLAVVHGNTRFGGGILNQGTLAVTDSTFSENIRIFPENVPPFASGGGAIENEATLSVTNCVFSKNGSLSSENPSTQGLLDGGAILNSGKLSVSRSTFSDNIIGNHGHGGGIANEGTATVSDSTFSGNSSGGSDRGGAIWNSGLLTISGSTFSANRAFIAGAIENSGGIFGTTGTLDIAKSTFSGNHSDTGVGAIENFGVTAITDSTFSGNSSNDRAFASIVNGGDLTVINNTFSGNGVNGTNVVDIGSSGTTRLRGTILASNPSIGFGGSFVNCGGTFTDLGYNISTDNSCGFSATGSLNNTDPLLDPTGLSNNGGPTQTVALHSGSPAIDAIPLDSCTDQDGNALTTDQRGFPRPDAGEGLCDIGAYEFQDFAGDPGKASCMGSSMSALSHQYRSLRAAASALGFGNVKALQNAIRAFCKG
jgi:hypothetical protein